MRIMWAIAFMAAAGAGSVRAQTVLFQVPGHADGEAFGSTVSRAGDTDGDGVVDVLAASPMALGEAGVVRLCSGTDGAVLHAWAGAAGDRLGRALAGVGDIDQDGRADVALGAPHADGYAIDAGAVHVYSGASGQLLLTFAGEIAGEHMGSAVAGVGDVDGDSWPDLAMGAPEASPHGPGSGRALIVSGRDGSTLHELFGDNTGDSFGATLCGVGLADSDGYPDFAIASPFDNDGGPDAGRVRVYSGRTGGVIHTLDGDSTADRFGSAVATAGDLDLDGRDDLAVGAWWDDPEGTDSGSVQVFSGASGERLLAILGNEAFGYLGAALDGGVDVDLDGWPDLLVGAFGYNSSGMDAGRAWVYSGRTGQLAATLPGLEVGDELGRALAFLGDADQDGFTDFAVGVPGSDAGASEAGAIVVHTACPLPPQRYCRGGLNSAGSSASLDTSGNAEVSVDDFHLLVSGATPAQKGQFFYGPRDGAIPFGDGTLCVSGGFHRAGPPVMTDAQGGARARLELGGSGESAILGGSSWYFQFVYLDPAGENGWNLSDALRIVFCD